MPRPTDCDSEPVRQFKGVWIPREIWEHPDLTWLEKCLLAEIDSLSRPDRPCTASNGWLGKKFKVSDDRIAHIISDLRQRGFINDIAFNGRIRSLRVVGFDQGCIGGNHQGCIGGNRVEPLVETNKAETSSNITTEYSESTVEIGRRQPTFETEWAKVPILLKEQIGKHTDFARMVFEAWDSVDGKNGNGVVCRFEKLLKKRWSEEGEAWSNGCHPKQKKPKSAIDSLPPELTPEQEAKIAADRRESFLRRLEADGALPYAIKCQRNSIQTGGPG